MPGCPGARGEAQPRFCVHWISIAISVFGADFMDQHPNALERLGRYSGAAVVLSIMACYGTLAVTGLLSLLGIALPLHEGAWATVIVVFAWLAVLAMGVNLRIVKNPGPFILCDVGALLVSWVMLVDYVQSMEVIGFLMLIAAAFWDRALRRRVAAAPPPV